MNNNLGFFKVYLPPPKGPERLPIPSAFVKHVKGAIPDKAFLRNCHGKLWPVVVTKVGNQLCFKDGWVKFVEDNSVEVGNFLVFDFDGNYVFDFKLFGSTECEIKMIESSGFKVKEEKEEEEEKVKEEEEEEEEEDELEANALRKKTEKGKSEKSTKGLKKIKQGTNYGNKGKVTIKDKGGNKRAYRMEDEEGDELEAKTLRKKTEKGKSEKSTKGLKKINQGTNYGNKGKATIKDKGGNKRAYRMEVEDEEEETDDDDEEDDELETTTLRKKTEKEKSEKSTKGLKKINQGTCCGNKRKATIKDKGGNKRAYTMEVEEEEEETDDDDEEEDELEAKALRKKTENGKREKSTKGLKKINQDTSYGNKGKATIKDKGGNKRAYTMEVEDEEEEEEEEETDDDDDEEDELEAKILRKKTEKEKSEKSAKGLEKISQGTSYGNKGKDTIKGKGENKRADTIAVEDDEDVFKYGMVSWPKNPCFVAKLRSTRRTELYVPMDVIRDHNLKLPSNLILLDEEGRKWSTKVVQWNDGRTWLTVGWKAFCKWNNLKWEDRCICEFIRGKGRRGLFIKTCILRAGSWLPKEDSVLSSDHRDQVDKRHFQGSPK